MAALESGERDRAIKAATEQIVKQFGKGAIMRLGDRVRAVDGDVIPTGSLALDIALEHGQALGNGGGGFVLVQFDARSPYLFVLPQVVQQGPAAAA